MRRDNDPKRLALAVGRRVRELRLARDLTQEKLAERLDSATPHVQAIERGVRNLTLASLCRIADALDVEAIQLLVLPRGEHAPRPGRPPADYGVARGTVMLVLQEADLSKMRPRPDRSRTSRARASTARRRPTPGD